MIQFKFEKLHKARKKAKTMGRLYGYTPEIFKVTYPKTKSSKYVVIKPKGLKRV